MGEILRRQFLQNVGQTSPAPLLIEVERAEGVFFYTPGGKNHSGFKKATQAFFGTAQQSETIF